MMSTGPNNCRQGSAGRGRGLWFGWLLCACLSVGSARAAAQRTDPDSSRDASARALFEEGVKLAETGAWLRAEDRFRRALSLRASAVIAYNLARALVEQGKLVEASENLRKLEQDDKIEASMMQSIQALQAELGPRIGRIAIIVRDPGPDDRVSLDGQELLPAQLGVEIPIDPGNHHLTLWRGDLQLADRRVEIPAGTSVSLQLGAARAPRPREVASASSAADPSANGLGAPAAVGGELRDSQPITGRWWFWTGLGVVVAGAAIAVAVAAGSSSAEAPRPYRGDFTPGSLDVQVAR
jgi:hypothetical protein